MTMEAERAGKKAFQKKKKKKKKKQTRKAGKDTQF